MQVWHANQHGVPTGVLVGTLAHVHEAFLRAWLVSEGNCMWHYFVDGVWSEPGHI